MRFRRHPANSGFSLVEGIITFSLIAVVCGLAFVLGGGFLGTVELTKLKQDVRTINSAADLFVANGGNLDGLTDPQAVLDRMKTAHTLAARERFVGMPGATIDNRLVAKPAHGRRDVFAAFWDPIGKQFEIEKNTGKAGTVFDLDDSLAEVDFGELPRGQSVFEYNEGPGWIWDYAEKPPTFVGGPSVIPVSDVPDTPPPAPPVRLQTPVIVLSSASFNNTTPEITVSIENPNALGSSILYYAIVPSGSGPGPRTVWGTYGGPSSTLATEYPDGFEVVTYAKSVTAAYLDSDTASAATTSEFFGTPTTGNVLFVVDASSSMNRTFGAGTRFDATIVELISAIEGLPHSIKFNVALFDQGIHWTDGTFRLHPADQINKEALISKVRDLKTDRGTNYSAALRLSTLFDPLPDQVILLSDGEPADDGYLSDLARLVTLGVRVDTVALNTPGKGTATLQHIADETGGTLQVVE